MKKGVLVLFIIIGVLMASSVVAGPLETIGDAFSKLFGSVGSLEFLGGSSDQFLGFIRILYAILVFTLLYFVTGGLLGDKIPKNISVTVSLIMAILVVILTPATLIIAIATAYSTAVAFILLGGLILGAMYLVLKDRTDSWGLFLIKAGAIVLSFWILGQFTAFLSGKGLYTALPAASELGAWGSIVDKFSEWSYLIFVGLLIWVIVDFFFLSKGEDTAYGTGSEGRRGWFGGFLGGKGTETTPAATPTPATPAAPATPTTPAAKKAKKKAKKSKKKAAKYLGRAEKTMMKEYQWLKDMFNEIHKRKGDNTWIVHTGTSKHAARKELHVSREERLVKRLKNRLATFEIVLDRLAKDFPAEKTQLGTWKGKLGALYDILKSKIGLTNSEFEKTLKLKVDPSNTTAITAKHDELEKCLKEAIDADVAMIKIMEDVKTKFKL